MRRRSSVMLTVAGAAALTLVVAQPAFAATRTWTQVGDSNWSTATWTGGVPVAGDDVTFSGGPRSTYDLGNLGLGWLMFPTTHEIANGGGAITLTGGIEVTGGRRRASSRSSPRADRRPGSWSPARPWTCPPRCTPTRPPSSASRSTAR